MGGGRCHFHDCPQKNDGVIHMFRFPVFDKIRCHRWLVAAGRMDLLSLKVSQVRNKQICQHHFRDYDFMNALKNSLKPSAIPLLRGPFCFVLKDQDPDDYPLMPDQVENEILLPKDMKPESLNLKLFDYLITSEMEGLTSAYMKPEIQRVSVSSYDYLNTAKPGPMKNQIVVIEVPADSKRRMNHKGPALPLKRNKSPKKIPPPKIEAPKSIDVQEILLEFEENPTKIVSEKTVSQSNLVDYTPNNLAELKIVASANIQAPKSIEVQEFDEKPNVTILSQKTVSSSNIIQHKPIKLAELKRIDPGSHVISNKHTHESLNKNVNSLLKENFQLNSIDLVQLNDKELKMISDNIPFAPASSENDNNTPNIVDKLNPPISEEEKVPEPVPLVKAKSEVIQEKRTFNRRLRDIIRESIDMADSRTPKEEANMFPTPNQEPKVVKVKSVKDTSNLESKIAISQLQNRIQTMEALLLNRIDANTKEVNDLKKVLMEKNKAEKIEKVEKEKKVIEPEEVRKKRLFNEISEYLSKESKSALYEQLFISKYPKRTRR